MTDVNFAPPTSLGRISALLAALLLLLAPATAAAQDTSPDTPERSASALAVAVEYVQEQEKGLGDVSFVLVPIEVEGQERYETVPAHIAGAARSLGVEAVLEHPTHLCSRAPEPRAMDCGYPQGTMPLRVSVEVVGDRASVQLNSLGVAPGLRPIQDSGDYVVGSHASRWVHLIRVDGSWAVEEFDPGLRAIEVAPVDGDG